VNVGPVLISGERSAGRKTNGGGSLVGGSKGATFRSLDLRCVFTKPKPVVVACRGSSAPDLVVEDPRQVVNRRNVPGGRRCVRGAVRLFATCRPFDLRCVFTRPKPVVLACRGSFPTIWWSRTLDKLSTVGMCPVVAAASVVRVRAFRGFTSAAVKCSQVALEHPALPARLASGAARVHQTFSVIAALSRVCADQMSRTTTLAETKRRVLISGKRSAGRKISGGARS
jgi:hypothetical protein